MITKRNVIKLNTTEEQGEQNLKKETKKRKEKSEKRKGTVGIQKSLFRFYFFVLILGQI